MAFFKVPDGVRNAVAGGVAAVSLGAAAGNKTLAKITNAAPAIAVAASLGSTVYGRVSSLLTGGSGGGSSSDSGGGGSGRDDDSDNTPELSPDPNRLGFDISGHYIGEVEWQQRISSKGIDWRVRLSVAPGSKVLYASGNNSELLGPLKLTGGIVFPILSNIIVTHAANYSQQELTHSNYQMFFYKNSSVASIQIVGEFPVQTVADGKYLLAAVYMLRAATKMYFGQDSIGSPVAGTPPPILRLNGYGKQYFPDIPVVVTNFTHTLREDVDYLSVGDGANATRVPTLSQIQVSLQPIYSRRQIREFDHQKFAEGGQLDKRFL